MVDREERGEEKEKGREKEEIQSWESGDIV